MSIYKTEIVTHIDTELITKWKQLWETGINATIYNSYEWFLTWQELTQNQNYEIFVCYRKDALVAILPLMKSRCYGVSVLTTLLNVHLTDTAFLMEKYDKEVFKRFFGMFLKKNIFIQKNDNKAALQLHNYFPQFFFSVISVNPVINMFPDPFQALSGSTIKKIRKTIRQNEDQLRFEMYKDDLPKHLQTMFAINEKSSKSLHGKNIFSQKEYRNFYSTILKHRPDLIRIYFLYFKNIPIAYKYGYLYKKNFASDQIAFLNEYGNISPGKISNYFLLKDLKDTNVASIDLGGGISSHKTKFTNEYRLLYNLYYSPKPGVLAYWKAINMTRRLKQRLLPKKNTRDHLFLFSSLNNNSQPGPTI